MAGKPHLNTGGFHGLVAWAVSTLVIVYLLSSAVGGLASGAFGAVTSTLGGAGSLIGGSVKTAAQAAAPSLPGMDNPFSNIEGPGPRQQRFRSAGTQGRRCDGRQGCRNR